MNEFDRVALEVFTDPPPDPLLDELALLQSRSYAAIGLRSWKASEIADTARLPAGRVLIARCAGGQVGGFLIANVCENDAEILVMAVDPVCQRRNIGNRLINFLLTSEKSVNIDRVVLEVAETNHVAVNFYKILNFQPISIRREYYLIDGCRVDAQLMEKRIT